MRMRLSQTHTHTHQVSGHPGSHVVIRCSDEIPPKETMLDAATLALNFSKVRLEILLQAYVRTYTCITCIYDIHTWIRGMHARIHAYTYTHIRTHTYAHTHIHAYMHTRMHIYIHAYIHTYIHTYIHIYTHKHTKSACPASRRIRT